MLAILNSPTIQAHTIPDPTSTNPNHRQSLVGHTIYSDFCAQHILEDLAVVARSHGWPYPPDFSTLSQRVKDKEGFLSAVTIGSMTGMEISEFYSDLLAMDQKKRHQQSLSVISAG